MAEWKWYYTDKTLPEIISGDGTSDYVLAFPGCGCLPKVVKYSDGSYTKRGWWTTDFRHLSMQVGGRCSTQQRFPFWSPIELPTFEKLLEQETVNISNKENIIKKIDETLAYLDCPAYVDDTRLGFRKFARELKDKLK